MLFVTRKMGEARSFPLGAQKAFSSFVLLTSPQLVQLKTLFHHMLSRSSSGAQSAAKNLSARSTVRMSCFTSNPAPIWYSWQGGKKREVCSRKSSPQNIAHWLVPRQSNRPAIFSYPHGRSELPAYQAARHFLKCYLECTKYLNQYQYLLDSLLLSIFVIRILYL